ncbi:uncharacterized protein LOC127138071 [Lathyrus oleraceus]|uniref:uncharacterized protein LOC127138071 n=1 Tax=Pisum sativum TaxID=3888 RepID=UPI0021CE9D89|nr:uncharacterized protein LOC127138071 [Pisum sativum]
MSALVNGSLTVDFKMERGLWKGYSLSPFLFVMAMEGLTSMMDKVVETGEYNGFKINDKVSIEILQFFYDTIIMGDENINNLWSIKDILRGFKMIFGLSVKCCKSRIYRTNVSDWLVEPASNFLSCKTEEIPLKLLGIWVGSSPRRLKLWKKFINIIRTRLRSSKGRSLLLGGKFVLINSVMNSLPTYTLSFYKVPYKFLKENCSILSKFLWCGLEEKKLIHCIKWEQVYKSK